MPNTVGITRIKLTIKVVSCNVVERCRRKMGDRLT